MIDQNVSYNPFGLWKKWFWMGIVMALMIIPGLVYGIALALEKENRKTGTIIIIASVVAYILFTIVAVALVVYGIIQPPFTVLKVR